MKSHKIGLLIVLILILNLTTIQIVNADPEVKPFMCNDIINTNYNGEYGTNPKGFTLSTNMNGGFFGVVEPQGWADYTYTSKNLKPIFIIFRDNLMVHNTIGGDTLKIECDDNTSKEFFIPKFKDIKGKGFETGNNGNHFQNPIYLGNDGNLYFDSKLKERFESTDQYEEVLDRDNYEIWVDNFPVSNEKKVEPKDNEPKIIEVTIEEPTTEQIIEQPKEIVISKEHNKLVRLLNFLRSLVN